MLILIDPENPQNESVIKRMHYVVKHHGVDCAELVLEIVKPQATIHFDVQRWNRKVAVTILEDWEEIKEILKNEGVKNILVTYMDIKKEKKWAKFIQLFGFPEPRHILISNMRLDDGD